MNNNEDPVPNYEDIGEIKDGVMCRMRGGQGYDGSKWYTTYPFNHDSKVVIFHSK